MSGHSKWHKIQHKKGAADKARSNLFTKLCRAITVAAQQGGGDPDMNFSLRLAIEKAKAGNVPKDNIERAIKRGTGELKDGAVLQELLYEGFGPGGVALIIESVTDNSNRSISEIKTAVTRHGGSMAGPGSVKWQFERKAVLRFTKEHKEHISDWDSFQLELMDAGADDIIESEEGVEIFGPVESFQKINTVAVSSGVTPDDAGLEWIAKESIALEENVSASIEKMIDALDLLDDVKEVYTNEK